MFRATAALLALAASLSVAFAATDDELREQIVGSWGQDSSCSSGRLTFAADGSFTLSRPDRNETGTWAIADGMLTGTTSDGSTRPEVMVSFGQGTLAMTSDGQTDTFSRCAAP